MKNVIILDEDDMERISSFMQQIDAEIGVMYNKLIPDDLKVNMCIINSYVQELGTLLGIWE